MRAAEDVQRQIAIAIVVAVKEPTLLMPVQRIVGGSEIGDDLLWRMVVRLHEQIDKQRLDPGAVPGDPMIAGRLYAAPLEPVECALAGQRRTILATGRQLAGQHRHGRVVAQLVVVDQVFDDCNIYVRSRRAGERVMASLSRFLTKKLRLKVNEAKSAVAR